MLPLRLVYVSFSLNMLFAFGFCFLPIGGTTFLYNQYLFENFKLLFYLQRMHFGCGTESS